MNKKVMKYNPAFLDDDELIRSFVVRYPELEIILNIIKENDAPSNQHVLVLGPRGIGKTTLTHRAAAEIRKRTEYNTNWHPITFGEESYQVSTPGEFWLEALFHIAQQTREERWRNTYEELHSERDETRLRERALAQLMDFADERNKRLLLIVENLNMIVGQQFNKNGEDAWVIRHTLTNEPRIMLLGTAITRFKEVQDYDKALYDLFREIELRPLDDEGCIKLWESITGTTPSMKRIRPIKILTGGNPRLLNIISTFAANSSFRELMGNLTHLVDEHTEYFKSHLDRFSPLDRKVLVALADLWDPSTARDVAKAARIEVNKTSTLLLRLVERGAVEVVDQKGKSKWYQVAERMYNIYHLMRRRGQPFGRVRAVVRFMVIFYESKELVKVAHSLVSEACKIEPEYRRDHYLAYESILKEKLDATVKRQILEHSRPLLEGLPDIPRSIKELFYEAEFKEAESHGKQRLVKYKRLIETIREWEDVAGDSKIIQTAAKKYRTKIEQSPNNTNYWFLLGYLLDRQAEDHEEVAFAFRKATELDPDHLLAWAKLGQTLHDELKRFEEAETAYRKAIKIDSKYSWAWASLGQLLHEELQRFDEAETAYRKAIKINS
ncbi:AAA family ATPase, partial [bacterium]|nr:AAA family ATPase [bacterium]